MPVSCFQVQHCKVMLQSEHVFDKQWSRSLCFIFMHYLQKITCFQSGCQEYQRIRMKIIDVITFRLLLIFPEISVKYSRKFPNNRNNLQANYNSNETWSMCVLFLFLLIFTLLDLLTIFITAHGKVSFASGVYAMGGISVCLSHSGIMSKRAEAEGCNMISKITKTFLHNLLDYQFYINH